MDKMCAFGPHQLFAFHKLQDDICLVKAGVNHVRKMVLKEIRETFYRYLDRKLV